MVEKRAAAVAAKAKATASARSRTHATGAAGADAAADSSSSSSLAPGLSGKQKPFKERLASGHGNARPAASASKPGLPRNGSGSNPASLDHEHNPSHSAWTAHRSTGLAELPSLFNFAHNVNPNCNHGPGGASIPMGTECISCSDVAVAGSMHEIRAVTAAVVRHGPMRVAAHQKVVDSTVNTCSCASCGVTGKNFPRHVVDLRPGSDFNRVFRVEWNSARGRERVRRLEKGFGCDVVTRFATHTRGPELQILRKQSLQLSATNYFCTPARIAGSGNSNETKTFNTKLTPRNWNPSQRQIYTTCKLRS
jgi:hypothetical protein